MRDARATTLLPETGLGAQLADWAELLRPRIAGMVAFTAFIAAMLACGPGGDLGVAFEVTLWVTLSAGAGSVLNQVLERDSDGLMARTAERPLVTGRIAMRDAIIFGGVLFLASLTGLALRFSLLAALLAAATLLLYLAVYTPLKKVSTFNTVPGAVAGAAPPAIAWAAVTGSLDGWGVWLAAILFVWQFPHFMAIAWLYRGDYAAAGMRMLPAMEGTEGLAGRQAALHALTLLPLTVFPYIRGMAGGFYVVCATTLAAVYLAASLRFAREEDEWGARALLLVSLLYLPLYLLLLLVDPGFTSSMP